MARAKFPEVFGCVGSTHIAVKSPGKALADGYMNEKGYYSFRAMVKRVFPIPFPTYLSYTHTHTNLVHLQIVCGPDFEFYEMISRWPGATHENKIFNISEVYQRFEYNQIGGVLLADHNYNTRSFVMTPIDSPHTANEWRYNEAHSGTYTVPAAIDLWKRRFKCLQTVINNAEGM